MITHIRQNGQRLTISDAKFGHQERYVLKVKMRRLRKIAAVNKTTLSVAYMIASGRA